MVSKSLRVCLAAGLASWWLSQPPDCLAQKGVAKRWIDQRLRSGNLSTGGRNPFDRDVDQAKPWGARDANGTLGGGGYRPYLNRPQQNYVRPQTNQATQPAGAFPASAPASLAPPKDIAPPKNELLSAPPPASSARLRKLQIKIDEYIDDTLDAISRDFQQGELGRAWQDELIQQLNGEGANPLLVDQLARLFSARTLDVDGIDELLGELRLSEESVARVRGQLQLSAGLQQLKRLVEEGADTTRMARVLRDMQRKSTSMQIAKKGRRAAALRNMRQALDSLSEASLLRDVLAERDSDRNLAAWPSGEMTIVYDPDCTPGESWLLTEDAVLASPHEGEGFRVTRGPLAAAMGASVFSSPAISDATSEVRRSGISIANPTTVAFPFMLNGQQHKLAAGAVQEFPAGSATIEFANVAERPARVYTLADGAYRFKYSAEAGWDIAAQRYAATIDNRRNSRPFRYLADGKEFTVAAGQKQEHRSSRPIVVAFDRADGGKPAKKIFSESEQTARVGVSEGGRLWDLFSDEATLASEAAE